MSEPTTIDHARPTDAAASDAVFLRRAIAAFCVAYGGLGLISTALHLGLQYGVLRSPSTMSWDGGGLAGQVLTAASALATSLLVFSGVFIARGRRVGVLLLRLVVAIRLVLVALGLAHTFRTLPTYATYWLTPEAAAVNVLQVIHGLWVPAIVTVLTLPPLARRIVVDAA